MGDFGFGMYSLPTSKIKPKKRTKRTMTNMKTTYVTVDGYAEYAKVFPENRDTADKTTHPGIKKMLNQSNGQYSINFYPVDETELNKCFGPLSHKMYGGVVRLREGRDLGVGKFIQLKRKHEDIRTTAKGEVNFGGPVEVVHFSEDEDTKGKPWSFEEDGTIGNGSLVRVKFSVYGEGTTQSVRLEKVGVIEHVAYEADGERF